MRLEKEITQEFIDDMIERFKNGKKIHKKYVYQIILAVKDIVYNEATMVEMEIPDDVKLTVCGDTHGKFREDDTITRELTSFVQASTSTLWSSSGSTESLATSTTTSSTATLSTVARGLRRLRCCSTHTSG